MLSATITADGSTDEIVRYGNVIVTAAKVDPGDTLDGDLAIEEWVPGIGWVTRTTLTGAGTETIVGNNTEPTRWRGTMANFAASDSWLVVIR